jgi:catechol 2,3-dioxygenase-like lactoylglutathione lyase family enzyme
MIPMSDQTINVDGVKLKRPFQIRRLGHFGLNVASPQDSMRFYGDLLGFEISDELDFGPRIAEPIRSEVGPTVGYFTRHGTDHHSFVLFPKKAVNAANPHYKDYPDLTINQITWQVSTLREVSQGHDWFDKNQVKILRSGRDTPGSNWHFYPVDPCGHINELYYGIEQIGWSGLSKPAQMHTIKHMKPPQLPYPSEFSEVQHALSLGLDIHSGFRRENHLKEIYDVGGVLLARPFKVSKIGPLHLWVEDVQKALDFYTHEMGLSLTEEVHIEGERCVFLRANTEHHALGLFPQALKSKLGLHLPNPSSLLSFGFQVGSYQQLLDAISFLKEKGCQFFDLAHALSPGMGHHVHLIDPDGFLIQLYWEMEQIGWDGQPRPQELRRSFAIDPKLWPSSLDPLSDSHCGEVFLGPLN